MGPKKHPLQTAADQALMGVDRSRRFCACGAVIGPRSQRCRRCTLRRAKARYLATEKGKATNARSRARQIRLNGDYRGQAQTAEQAAIIRNHIKERTREFIARQQAGAEIKGAAAGAVSTEAKP